MKALSFSEKALHSTALAITWLSSHTNSPHTLLSPISKAYKYSTQPCRLDNQDSFGVSFRSNEEGTYRRIPSIMTSFEMTACGKWAPCQRSRLMFDLTLTGRFAPAIAMAAKAARVTHNRISFFNPSHYATKTNLSVIKMSCCFKKQNSLFSLNIWIWYSKHAHSVIWIAGGMKIGSNAVKFYKILCRSSDCPCISPCSVLIPFYVWRMIICL